MNNPNFIKRAGGLAVLACVCIAGTLHGCSRHYIDSTQRSWLGTLDNSIEAEVQVTAPQANSQPGQSIQARVDQRETSVRQTRLSGRLQTDEIGELSGLAVSQRDARIYWAINDSGNTPVLYAIGRNGKSLEAIDLPFANRDWEALASFKDYGKSWLLIADTGDNLRRRPVHTLYIIEEPVAHSARRPGLQRRLDFTYEDGPQNVESVAVSVSERTIFLISKDALSPRLYALPLDPVEGPQVARLVGPMKPLPFTEDDRLIERLLAGRFLLGPTALDINAEETLAVVANYRHAYLYRRDPSQSWTQALMQVPEVITSHRLAQSESVAFGLNDGSVLVGSEGVNAPLLIVAEPKTAN